MSQIFLPLIQLCANSFTLSIDIVFKIQPFSPKQVLHCYFKTSVMNIPYDVWQL